jgi:hypothetical protein
MKIQFVYISGENLFLWELGAAMTVVFYGPGSKFFTGFRRIHQKIRVNKIPLCSFRLRKNVLTVIKIVFCYRGRNIFLIRSTRRIHHKKIVICISRMRNRTLTNREKNCRQGRFAAETRQSQGRQRIS